MPDVKVIIAAAAFAFVVSLISGIIGGVGFLTIIFRAVLGAGFFGLLAAGLSLLLQKMVPELFETGELEMSAAEDSAEGRDQDEGAAETGGHIDITLGEESGEAAAEEAEDAAYEASDEEQEEENFVEEVAEEEGNGSAAPAAGEGEAAESTKKAPDIDSLIGTEDVDSLPDLEDFADSFEGVAASQNGDGDSGAGSASGSGAASGGGFSASEPVDVFGTQEDPETVAKALRTFMKKDQEG
jgi:hypothetical protein